MAETPQDAATSPTNGKKWLVRSAIGFLTIAILATVVWLALPRIVAQQLREALGARSYPQVLSEAEKDNDAALSRLQPRVLVDVPAEPVIDLVRSKLVKSASDLPPVKGAKIELASDPSITLLSHALRAAAHGRIRHPEWGEIDLKLQIDAVPKVRDGSIVITPVITHAELRSISPFGFRLPSVATSLLERIVVDSLEALSNRFDPVVLPLKIPDQIVAAVGGSPALLVTDKSVAALLGTDDHPQGHAGADYASRFVAAARTVLDGYEPGQGVVAFASGGRMQGDTLADASNALRDQAVAENLAAAERTLLITSATDPATLTTAAFAPTTLLSISPGWFSRQLKEKIGQVIAGLSPDGVALSISPDDVSVGIVEGAIEASVAGTAAFNDGVLKIDFALKAWATAHPEPGGIVVRYRPRSVEIRRLLVGWAGRETMITVSYGDALGDILNRIIGDLPKYPVAVPPLPLKFKVPDLGAFKLVLKDTSSKVHLLGRSILVSPRRVSVLSAVALSAAAEPGYPAAKPSAGQFRRLEAIVERGEALLRAGDETRDKASLFIGKAGLASLMDKTWTTLDPYIHGDHRDEMMFDAGEINLIPPDASCGHSCEDAARCGNPRACFSRVCREVVRYHWVFVGAAGLNPFGRRVLREIRETVCPEVEDAECSLNTGRCLSTANECMTRWATGIQPTCMASLALINRTNFRGLARVSGNVSVDASGQTFPNARLVVAPDLGRADLAVRVSGRANVRAQVDVAFRDFGRLFHCPDGRLSANVQFTGSLSDPKLSATIAWTGGGDGSLTAKIVPASPTVQISSGEPPIVALARDNPGLLLCGPARGAIAAIVGLSIVSTPRLTRELLANSIRQAIPGDRGALAAALFDGQYRFTPPVAPVEFTIPTVPIDVLSSSVTLSPRMTQNAVVLGLQGN